MIPQEPPPHDSQNSGKAESGIRQVKEKVRTLVVAARELHDVVIDSRHRCLEWAIRYAGQLITRTVKGPDGLTAFQKNSLKEIASTSTPSRLGRKSALA